MPRRAWWRSWRRSWQWRAVGIGEATRRSVRRPNAGGRARSRVRSGVARCGGRSRTGGAGAGTCRSRSHGRRVAARGGDVAVLGVLRRAGLGRAAVAVASRRCGCRASPTRRAVGHRRRRSGDAWPLPARDRPGSGPSRRPFLACTWLPSTHARDQSIASAPRNRPNRLARNCSHTPASVHCSRRRQQVTPEPKPSSAGSAFHGIPVTPFVSGSARAASPRRRGRYSRGCVGSLHSPARALRRDGGRPVV
jgi:hypothetical protein